MVCTIVILCSYAFLKVHSMSLVLPHQTLTFWLGLGRQFGYVDVLDIKTYGAVIFRFYFLVDWTSKHSLVLYAWDLLDLWWMDLKILSSKFENRVLFYFTNVDVSSWHNSVILIAARVWLKTRLISSVQKRFFKQWYKVLNCSFSYVSSVLSSEIWSCL